jgi:hypothetical protein
MPSHTLRQGDHLSRVAQQYGFRDYRLIWDDPQNADLKKKRGNPNVLLPGDVLFIPAKQQKTETRPTTDVHTFRLKAARLMLRLVVRDFDNRPIPGTACELEVEGRKYALTTDGQGRIQQAIPATAENAVLRIAVLEMELPVKIGHLDPPDETSGWRQRLINLGYHFNPLDDGDETKLSHAIEEFQCDHGLKVTGQLDSATQAKLKDEHGC